MRSVEYFDDWRVYSSASRGPQTQGATAGVEEMLDAARRHRGRPHVGPAAPAIPANTMAALTSPAGPGSTSASSASCRLIRSPHSAALVEHRGDAGIGGKHRHEAPVSHRQRGVAAEHVLRPRVRRALRLRGFDDGSQLVEDRLENSGEQLLAGPEMVIDGGFGEPQLVGDHLQRRAREAVPGEQVDRGLDQSRPGIGGLQRPHSDQVRHRHPLNPSKVSALRSYGTVLSIRKASVFTID